MSGRFETADVMPVLVDVGVAIEKLFLLELDLVDAETFDQLVRPQDMV